MTFPLRAICVLALAGFVGACQTWARLEPAPLDVAGDYTVEPDIVWSVNRLGDTYHLTVDGPMLQRAVLSAGVGDGEALIDIPEAARERNSDSDLPAYENDMSPIELVEFYKSTLSAWGFEQIEISNVRPTALAGRDAVALDFEMVNKDGLAYRGLARLSPAEDHLDGILYFGTDLYHFEKHRANAIALIRSVRWAKPDD